MKRPSKKEPSDPKQEFRDLLRASGWSQAEAARQLAMTPGALSQIVRHNSPVRPSRVTLRLFRLLLLREKPAGLDPAAPPEKPPAEEPWAADLLQTLRKISPKTRRSILETLRPLLAAAQPTVRDKQRPKQKPSGVRPPGSG